MYRNRFRIHDGWIVLVPRHVEGQAKNDGDGNEERKESAAWHCAGGCGPHIGCRQYSKLHMGVCNNYLENAVI